MAGMSVRFRVTGLDRLERTIARTKRALRDLRPLFELYEADWLRLNEEHFDKGGRGAKWAPNSPVYAEIKAREYGERRVMHLRGDLRTSLTVAGGAGQVRKVTDRSMVLGTSIRYAETHDGGSSALMWIPRPFYMWIRGVPARPLIGFGQRRGEDERAWQTIGERYYRQIIEGRRA